eukprot:s4799_g2.t1
MAGLESVPAFTERAKQIGISEELLKKFIEKNLDTNGKLAFICSSRPSSGDDKALFDSIKELTGLELDVHTEPGHALVDRVQAMLDTAQVLHIAPEKCISRHDEILGDKSEQKFSLGADGNIKITKQASSLRCETPGELKLRRCFLRRALAFDQVGLASFTTMESWHNKMFQALLDAPPAGYRYTTVQQILAADQKLWQVVAQDSRGDISIGVGMPAPLDKHIAAASNNQFVMSCLTHLPKPPESPAPLWKPHKGGKGDKGENSKGGSRGDISIGVGMPAPLDKHIAAASNNQFVMSCLTHLPKPPESPAPLWKPHKGGKGDKGENSKGGKNGKGKSKGGKSNQSKASPAPLWKPHKGGKGDKGENSKGGKNGKGKSKGGKSNQSKADASANTSLKELLDSLPEGCVRATDEGRFICPFYNKSLCRFQKRKSCRFGKHVCNFKGCGAERPYIECRH